MKRRYMYFRKNEECNILLAVFYALREKLIETIESIIYNKYPIYSFLCSIDHLLFKHSYNEGGLTGGHNGYDDIGYACNTHWTSSKSKFKYSYFHECSGTETEFNFFNLFTLHFFDGEYQEFSSFLLIPYLLLKSVRFKFHKYTFNEGIYRSLSIRYKAHFNSSLGCVKREFTITSFNKGFLIKGIHTYHRTLN